MTAIYIRTATREEDALLQQVHMMSGHEGEWYIDYGFSGANLNRPAWRRLVHDIMGGRVDTVMMRDTARIARNNWLLDVWLSQFKMLGIKMKAVNEPDFDLYNDDDQILFRSILKLHKQEELQDKVYKAYIHQSRVK